MFYPFRILFYKLKINFRIEKMNVMYKSCANKMLAYKNGQLFMNYTYLSGGDVFVNFVQFCLDPTMTFICKETVSDFFAGA